MEGILSSSFKLFFFFIFFFSFFLAPYSCHNFIVPVSTQFKNVFRTLTVPFLTKFSGNTWLNKTGEGNRFSFPLEILISKNRIQF